MLLQGNERALIREALVYYEQYLGTQNQSGLGPNTQQDGVQATSPDLQRQDDKHKVESVMAKIRSLVEELNAPNELSERSEVPRGSQISSDSSSDPFGDQWVIPGAGDTETPSKKNDTISSGWVDAAVLGTMTPGRAVNESAWTDPMDARRTPIQRHSMNPFFGPKAQPQPTQATQCLDHEHDRMEELLAHRTQSQLMPYQYPGPGYPGYPPHMWHSCHMSGSICQISAHPSSWSHRPQCCQIPSCYGPGFTRGHPDQAQVFFDHKNRPWTGGTDMYPGPAPYAPFSSHELPGLAQPEGSSAHISSGPSQRPSNTGHDSTNDQLSRDFTGGPSHPATQIPAQHDAKITKWPPTTPVANIIHPESVASATWSATTGPPQSFGPCLRTPSNFATWPFGSSSVSKSNTPPAKDTQAPGARSSTTSADSDPLPQVKEPPKMVSRRPLRPMTPKQFLEQGYTALRASDDGQELPSTIQPASTWPNHGLQALGVTVPASSEQVTARSYDPSKGQSHGSSSSAITVVDQPPPYTVEAQKRPRNALKPSGFAPLQRSTPSWQTSGAVGAEGNHRISTGFVGVSRTTGSGSGISTSNKSMGSFNPEKLAFDQRSPPTKSHHLIREGASNQTSSTVQDAPTVNDDDMAELRKMQDKFDREDEAAFAKQEAFARKVQADLNRRKSQSRPGDGTRSGNKSSVAAEGVIAPRYVVVNPPPTSVGASSLDKKRQSATMSPCTASHCDLRWEDTGAPSHGPNGSAAQGNAATAFSWPTLTAAQMTSQHSQAIDKTACTACGDKERPSDMATLPCSHAYCALCISDAFKHALAANKVFICCNRTPCPVSAAERFLPADFVTQYKIKMEERTTSNPIYCAKPGCAAFISPQNLKGPLATCGKCGFVTCSLCKNPEHKGVCPPDKMGMKLMNLADNKHWIQCKRCNAIVERDEGCLHMTCTCGYEFCYSCGGPWNQCSAKCPRRR